MAPKLQLGGDLVTDVKALAIPFSLLLAMNGVDFLKKKKTPTSAKKTEKKTKTSQKGGCGCGTKRMVGGTPISKELAKLSDDIKTILNQYSA